MNWGENVMIENAGLSKLRLILPKLLENLSAAISYEAMFEVGNDTVALLPTRNAYGSHCYNVIMNALTISLALSVSRLFDWKPNDPEGTDRASIPIMLWYFGKMDVRVAVIDEYADMMSQFGSRAENKQFAVRCLNELNTQYRSIKNEHKGLLKRLKQLRDFRLAHSLLFEGSGGLPYQEMFQLIRVSEYVASRSRLILTCVNWDPEEFREEQRRIGEAFWKPTIPAVFKG